MIASKKMKGATLAMTMIPKKSRLKQRPQRPALRFSPTAWAKLLYLRNVGETEIGGFGIAPPDDLLYVDDLQLVGQIADWASVRFDDQSVADYFDAQVDAGCQPEQFFRLFKHTHPGNSPQPSLTDEATFTRVFGQADWAVMFILARRGTSYARLRYNVGPELEVELPVEIDCSRQFAGSDELHWHDEYRANVRLPALVASKEAGGDFEVGKSDDPLDDSWLAAWSDYNSFDFNPEDEFYDLNRRT